MLLPALRPPIQLYLVSGLFVCCLCWQQESLDLNAPTLTSAPTVGEQVEQGVIWLNETEVRNEIGYPELAKRAGISGQVTLDLLINESGHISELAVTHSDHPLLEVACIDNLILSEFASAIKDGSPVAAWTSVQFSFQ